MLEGFDFGFVEDTNGLNNFQLGIELSYKLIDIMSINGFVASSLGVWKGSSNEYHTWGGINISTDF